MQNQSCPPNERMVVFLNHSGVSTHTLKKLYAHALTKDEQFYFFDTLISVTAVLKRRLPNVLVFYFDAPDSISDRLIRFYRKSYPSIPIIAICDTTPEEAIYLRHSGADKILSRTSLLPSMLQKAVTTLGLAAQKPKMSFNGDLEEILRHQHEGILVLEQTTDEILYYNPAGAELLGSSEEELTGKPCELFYQIGQQIECTIENRGSSLNVQITAQSIQWQNKPAVMISMLDMSRRKALEALLRKEKFVQALQQLSGAIAHEFAQPLQVIKLISEILRVEGVDPEYISRLESNCNTMNELVLNLRSIVDLQIQSYPGGKIMDLRASASRSSPVYEETFNTSESSI